MWQHLQLKRRHSKRAAIDTAPSTINGGHLSPQASCLWAFFFLTAMASADNANQRAVEEFRAAREQSLKAPYGWLSVAGLFWLKPGENRIGSAPDSDIVLPARAPAHAGTVTLRNGAGHYQPVTGSAVSLKPNSADAITIGTLKLLLIERGGMLGMRLKDNDSQIRQSFTHLSWFPYREDWVIKARYVPYDKPHELLFDAQAGGKQKMTAPGYVEFQRNGATYRLTPVLDGEGWEFVFRDKTAGKTTYAAARFLDTEPAKDGYVTLDFNRAYNPPCVFTPYATCPLPPPENRLSIAVEAGEMMYGKQH